MLNELAQHRIRKTFLVGPVGIAKDALQLLRIDFLDGIQGLANGLAHIYSNLPYFIPVCFCWHFETVVFVESCIFQIAVAFSKGIFIFLVTLTDPDLPLKAIVFECVSAFATVGSSLGITSQLQDSSKVLLVVLMFIGRVGLVTLAQGLLKQYKNQNYKLPQDNITIS